MLRVSFILSVFSLLVALLLLATALVAADKNSLGFPLRVYIAETHWQADAWGVSGYGYGDLYDGGRWKGFTYTFDCDRWFLASEDGATYPARWKKPHSTSLVILANRIGNSSKHDKCELRTTIRPLIYVEQYGHLVTYTPAQAKDFNSLRNSNGTSNQTNAPTHTSVNQNSPLTNSDVVSMIRAGLSQEIIIAKIQTSPCAFDTSADALRQLKAQNIPDGIVLEMVKRGNR